MPREKYALVLSMFFVFGAVCDSALLHAAQAPVWSHDFGQRITKLEALPGTFLAVTTVEKVAKKTYEDKLWLFDGKNGKLMWEGKKKEAEIITSGTHPIVFEQLGRQLDIKALDRDSSVLWTQSFDTVSLSVAVDPAQREIVILGSSENWWNTENKPKGVLRVLSMSGDVKWQVELGELDLPPVVPLTVMTLTPQSVWMAVGGRVLRVSRTLQEMTFSQPFEVTLGKKVSPIVKWHARNKTAVLVIGGKTALLDAKEGIVWTASVDQKNPYPDSVFLTRDTVVTGFRLLRKERKMVYVAAYDRVSGQEKWTYRARDGIMAKWERVSGPPDGLAVGQGRVVVAIRNSLVGLDMDTGKAVYTIKLKKAEYTLSNKVDVWKDKCVLFGKYQIRCHDLKTGKKVWFHKRFRTPRYFALHSRRIAMGFMGAAMAAAATMQEFSAQSMKNLANTKIAGKSGDKSSHYVFSPSARYQMTSAAQGAARSSAWYNVTASLSDVDISQWVKLVSSHDMPDTHVQPKIYKNKLGLSCVAVLNLNDGAYEEIFVTPKGRMGCVPALAADMEGKMIYATSHMAGLLCKGIKKLEAYEFEIGN